MCKWSSLLDLREWDETFRGGLANNEGMRDAKDS